MDGFDVIHCYQTWALRNSIKTRPAKSRSIRHQKFVKLWLNMLNGLHQGNSKLRKKCERKVWTDYMRPEQGQDYKESQLIGTRYSCRAELSQTQNRVQTASGQPFLIPRSEKLRAAIR